MSKLCVLDFDIENRPLTYLGSDYNTGDVTAIAWSWLGEDEVNYAVQTLEDGTLSSMLREFTTAYDHADMVTGHYIRGYDLTVLNGAMLEAGLPPMDKKMSSDTKLDLKKTKYQSMSQESLSAMLGIEASKVHMTQQDWREANRLTPEGIDKTIARVTGDVIQHKALRAKLIELGWLGTPKVWSPEAKGSAYRP